MLIKPFNGKSPRISASALIADNVYIIGDVEIGEECSIWPGVVIRGDTYSVKIGNNVHIEENTIVHTFADIGDNTLIGHNCHIEAPVGRNTLIGNGASLNPRSKVGNYNTIAAGAVVVGGTEFPDYTFAAGMPAKAIGTVDPDDKTNPRNLSYYIDYQRELADQYRQQGIWARSTEH
jgi:carbonic anhydrase/acetyltransferase-like protein (isoleucine patch superfamily)